jgi:Uma2 family endonuclease
MPSVSIPLPKQPLKNWSPAQTIVTKPKCDRPGWIPSQIKSNWDTYPYAYQTEEEMMPQGGLHGLLSAYICELLRSYLKEQNFMLLQDPFLLYQDKQQIKQRIAPDLLLMPFRFPPPLSYDISVEQWPPPCVIEITSPESHQKDLDDNKILYMSLGISTYLVIDAITSQGELRPQIELRGWRLINGNTMEIIPDRENCLVLPEMGLKVGTEGQKLFFIEKITGNRLFNSTELKKALQSEVQRAEMAEQRAKMEAQRADIEAQRADIEAKRAKAEAERANLAEQREAKARHAAEAEIARLKALLG